jgi:hypothetical protein
MTMDFGVDLDRLTVLRSRLSALHASLLEGPAGGASTQANLDPRAGGFSAGLVRAEGVGSRYVYGRLRESDPLGAVHEQVTGSVLALVEALQGMVGAMVSAAGSGGLVYGEAEDSVRAAVDAAGSGAVSGSEAGAGGSF